MTISLTQHELSQDPHDFIATHLLLHATSGLTGSAVEFGAAHSVGCKYSFSSQPGTRLGLRDSTSVDEHDRPGAPCSLKVHQLELGSVAIAVKRNHIGTIGQFRSGAPTRPSTCARVGRSSACGAFLGHTTYVMLMR